MDIQQQLLQATSWEQRYRLIIQAGKNLEQPSTQQLEQWQEIQGCEAKLWCKISLNSDRSLQFQAYSEARIMNGLLWLLIQELNNKPIELLATFDISQFLAQFDITSRLSSTRLNGLKQIEQLIKKFNLS